MYPYPLWWDFVCESNGGKLVQLCWAGACPPPSPPPPLSFTYRVLAPLLLWGSVLAGGQCMSVRGGVGGNHTTTTQHYHTTLSHNTVTQHCHTTLSQNTATHVTHNTITQHYYTTLSHAANYRFMSLVYVIVGGQTAYWGWGFRSPLHVSSLLLLLQIKSFHNILFVAN